jgi:hypothetical protein
MSKSQHHETSVFRPSLASVTTSRNPKNLKISKSIVNYHRDEIPPEDLASFSCSNARVSLPATGRVTTVLTTAGSSSLFPMSSLKLRKLN